VNFLNVIARYASVLASLPGFEPAALYVLFIADQQQHEAIMSLHSDPIQPRPEFLRLLNPRSRQRVGDYATRSLGQLRRQARWRLAAVAFASSDDVPARPIDRPAPRALAHRGLGFPAVIADREEAVSELRCGGPQSSGRGEGRGL
jgi:hypothetical protein